MQWCPACQREVGVIMDVHRRFQQDKEDFCFLCVHCLRELPAREPVPEARAAERPVPALPRTG